MHILSITYGTNNNCKALTLQDASVYNAMFPLQNVILEVKPPGKSCFTSFSLLAGWCSKTFSCIDFDLCCISDERTVLPDGIYEIKYSVDPNLATMIEIDHFRICNLYRIYLDAVCELRSNKCSYSHKDYKSKTKLLYEIKNMMADAVILVEECLNKEAGIALYEEAKILLNAKGCPTCH